MENLNTEKNKKTTRDRKIAQTIYSKRSEVHQKFCKIKKYTYKDGNISCLQKELISIGISVVIDCKSCMEWHIKQALDIGATEAEIIEAIEVGIEMGNGQTTVSARFAMDVLEFYTRSE